MHPLEMKAAGAAIALTCGLALSGCGGGDGNGGDQRPEPRAGTPALPVAVVAGDVVIEIGPGQGVLRAPVECGETECTITLLGERQTIDLDELDLTATRGITGGRDRNGVQIRRIAGVEDETGLSVVAWGIWGDHNAASPMVMTGTVDGVEVQAALPLSIGLATGSNPTAGSASWTGAMAGVKIDATSVGAEVTGDAAMTVDFGDATLDLEFTNIATDSGVGSPNINWRDVTMRRGAFEDAGLDGRFYGPGHVEAGGVFDRDGIEGAFSLARQ